MKKILSIVKWLLLGWGAFSLLCLVLIVGLIIFQLGPGNHDRADLATKQDVRFVLNWCELGDERIEEVVHSYVSRRSITGDHLDAYAIKISHVSAEELTASTDDFIGRWYRGDHLPKVVDDAVSFVGGWLGSDEISWFPKEEELRSSEVYVYAWTILYHGIRPTAAEVIFVRPRDKMVFFFSGKT